MNSALVGNFHQGVGSISKVADSGNRMFANLNVTPAKILLTGLMLTSACSNINNRYRQLVPVDPGSFLDINLHADIPLFEARVYFQQGKLIEKSSIDKFDTYCSVLMNRVQEEGAPQLSISPGQFEITQLRFYNDYNYQPRIIASRQWFYDPPSDVVYETEFRLRSPDQPLVRALICANRVDAYGMYYPDLTQIRQTLGDLIVLP